MISSPPEWTSYKEAPISGNWFKRWIKSRFRFVDYPFLLAYRGYGNREEMLIQGHVFRGMALHRPRKRHSPWKNFIALIKMFMVRTVPEANVQLECKGEFFRVKTNASGFFEFRVKNPGLEKGWHTFELKLMDELVEGQEEIKVQSEVLIEYDFEYGLISDIDDTFLVSHVTKIVRKLYVLLTKNAETRKPFKGVVEFYKKLSRGVETPTNPFFYVSSSEWNLYDFLINFTRHHRLPKGVLQLKDIKDSLMDFIRSGYGSHDHKRVKIENIFRMYPEQSFILLGDNGQHDPDIYLNIAMTHREQVKAVYIRGVKRSHRKKADEVLEKIRELDIPVLQFRRSAEASAHARQHGFIR
ncbi:MAG TPA: hypothetical protein DCG19_12805 [Cryomorphaceae bacterium]|nr:hypothetical protein [Owenweeksia sp.]HAD98282.1 hypothetical protein [Cryomorphaceae bacterium]HBF18866.1 hypothetical protein [Cryomorphaceae bacterium]|tara:strand:- start:1197 stop:2261 length:1065 start_codon:yes stop_codon:yes gene_type:complete